MWALLHTALEMNLCQKLRPKPEAETESEIESASEDDSDTDWWESNFDP